MKVTPCTNRGTFFAGVLGDALCGWYCSGRSGGALITSYELSQMMANQQNMFAGQNAYAQQIGVGPPPMASGMLPGGLPGSLQPERPYQPAQAGMFGPGMGAGNALAGGMMSGLAGGVAGVGTASGVLGMASSFGVLGKGMMGKIGGVAAAADPFAIGMGAYGMARGAMGMGMLGAGAVGMAASAVPMAAAAYVSKGFESFIEGGRGQQQLNNALQSNFKQYNSNARGGEGFSRSDATAIGQSMRGLEYLPDMMTSMEEMTQKILPKLKAMGALQGARDAGEFAKKFKEAVTTISDISRVLGTTMEDATKLFEHSRSVGFMGKKDQLRNMMGMKFAAGETGSTVEEIGAMQQSGAATARGFGATGRQGAEMVMKNVSTIQQAMSQGHLRDGFLEDYTGLSGPAGVRAASERISATMANAGLRKSAMGNAMMLGMMKLDEDGKPVLRQDLADKFERGEVTREHLQGEFSKMTRGEKMAFVANPASMSAQFAKLSPKGLYGFAEAISKNKDPNAIAMILQKQFGVQEQDVELLRASYLTKDTEDDDKRDFAARQMQEMRIREKTDISGSMTKFFKRKSHHMFGGYAEAGAKAFNAVGAWGEDTGDEIMGRAAVRPDEEFVQAMRSAGGGEGGRLRELSGRGASAKESIAGEGAMMNAQSILSGLRGVGTFKTAKGDVEDILSDLNIEGRKFVGTSSDAAVHAGQTALGDLQKKGQGKKFKEHRGIMSDIISELDENEEFRHSTAAEKAEKIKSYLAGPKFFTGSASDTRQINRIAKLKEFGSATEAAYGLTDETNRDLMQEKTGFAKDMSIESAAADIKKAGRDLGGASSATMSLMQSGKSDVFFAATKDEDTRRMVQEVIRKEDNPEVAAKILSGKLGKKISAGDVEGLGRALTDVSKDKGIVKLAETYGGKKSLEFTKLARAEAGVLSAGFTETGGSAGLKGLKEAMSLVGSGTGANLDLSGVAAASSTFAEELMSVSGKEAEELINKLPEELRGKAKADLAAAKKISKNTSIKEIMALTGLSEDEVKKTMEADTGGSRKGAISEETRKKLFGKALGADIGGVMAGAGVSGGGTTDKPTDKLLKVLSSMEVAVRGLSTNIEIQRSGLSEKQWQARQVEKAEEEKKKLE